jgi:putative acetyltransferase
MKESIIRKPLPTEIEAIIKIWLDGNMQAHPFIQPDYWLNHIGYMRQVLPLSEVYVCEVEGEIAGFIGLDGDHIAGLFVDKSHQSQGIGTSLIEFIKDKHFTLTLAVYKKNEKAMRFYCKQNFVAMKERIDANTNEAELVMRWNRACPIK